MTTTSTIALPYLITLAMNVAYPSQQLFLYFPNIFGMLVCLEKAASSSVQTGCLRVILSSATTVPGLLDPHCPMVLRRCQEVSDDTALYRGTTVQ